MENKNCASCLYSTVLCRTPIYAIECKHACCKAKSPKCWEPVRDDDYCDCWEPDTREETWKPDAKETADEI